MADCTRQYHRPVLRGTRLGVFEIQEPLGVGGMGEVYRARDTRLQRDVALKLLPASVAAEPDRLARFTREAQLVAALNHPNIGAIHGLEESGARQALVLELVEGPTLADRVAGGPLPLDEVVPIAHQIADALEYAHEHGIVHRDLKPANVKLRPDGTVKVLDFGLAKALTASVSMSESPSTPTDEPTITSPATMPGVVLGTAAYMAPEQARARPVDRRVDIWAFGVVLFEMLAGRRPFGGSTTSDTLAAILRDEPDWQALPASTPVPLRQLVRRTLDKNPRNRLRDIGDARVALDELRNGTPDPAATPAAPAPAWRRALPWAVACLSIAIAGLLLTRARPSAAPDVPSLKYTLSIPGLELDRTALPSLSPDGRRMVYASAGQLWVRDLDKLDARPLTGVTGPQFPFWSPDGRQVAYLTANALWRVGLDGSPPVRIAACRFTRGGRTPGGVWRRDGTIVFAPAANGSGFMAVSGEGGEFRELAGRDPTVEGDYHRPSLLPDGESLLYVVDRLDTGADTIAVMTGGTRKTILRLNGEFLDSPVYSRSGHVLYQRETTTPGIWAVPFSLDRLEVTGTPFLVVPEGSWPAVGANGLLVYAQSELTGLHELVWVDVASGAISPALKEQFPEISFPRLSPDGTRVAAVAHSPEGGGVVIVADLQRQTHVAIAERATGTSRPAWRDDRHIVYALDAGRREVIAIRRADASEPQVELFDGMQPSAIRNGRLLFVRLASGQRGLWHAALPAGGGPPAEPTLWHETPEHESDPALSPDGAWLAYTRGDTGQSSVMLRRYPEGSDQWQVSVAGGSQPVWSPSGDKLYFREYPGAIKVVDVETTPQLRLSAPRTVPREPGVITRIGYDVSRDGKRLLMVSEVKGREGSGPALAVVQNWLADFRREP
jgi:serine/threonine-protein kinase